MSTCGSVLNHFTTSGSLVDLHMFLCRRLHLRHRFFLDGRLNAETTCGANCQGQVPNDHVFPNRLEIRIIQIHVLITDPLNYYSDYPIIRPVPKCNKASRRDYCSYPSATWCPGSSSICHSSGHGPAQTTRNYTAFTHTSCHAQRTCNPFDA